MARNDRDTPREEPIAFERPDGSVLDNATTVTCQLLLDEINTRIAALAAERLDPERLHTAAARIRAVAPTDDLPPFLTTVALEQWP